MSSVFWYRLRFRRDHQWAPGHMSEYLDDGITSSARKRMDRHTEECPECRGVLGSLRRMLDELHRLPPSGAGADAPDIAAAVRLRLHEPPVR